MTSYKNAQFFSFQVINYLQLKNVCFPNQKEQENQLSYYDGSKNGHASRVSVFNRHNQLVRCSNDDNECMTNCNQNYWSEISVHYTRIMSDQTMMILPGFQFDLAQTSSNWFIRHINDPLMQNSVKDDPRFDQNPEECNDAERNHSHDIQRGITVWHNLKLTCYYRYRHVDAHERSGILFICKTNLK